MAGEQVSASTAQPSDAACHKLYRGNVMPEEAHLFRPDSPHVPAPRQRFEDDLSLGR